MNPGTQDLHCLEYGVILDMTRVQMQGKMCWNRRIFALVTDCTAHVTKIVSLINALGTNALVCAWEAYF
jgi:hypothetical protein